MSSLPEVVGGIATGNATLVGMAPGLTPAIAEAATVAAVTACASLTHTALHRDVQSLSQTPRASLLDGMLVSRSLLLLSSDRSRSTDLLLDAKWNWTVDRAVRLIYRLHSGAQRLTD